MIRNGIDRVRAGMPLFRNKRIGMLTHSAATDWQGHRSADIIAELYNCVLFFGPEHGLDGVAQAADKVDDQRDKATGLPVISLYGKRTAPTMEELSQIDLLVCDLQDIGSRFYTFLYSMSDTMRACAEAGVRMVILDRFNPVGGVRCEGSLLEPEQASFVGRFPIPVRHALTIGECARLFNELFKINCELIVVPCTGWKRNQEFEDSKRTWINPSPNMPSAACARVYNGMCFLEGTNMSEGRGTTRPYEMVGAPYVDAEHMASALNDFKLRGILFRPCRFVPTFSKYQGELCHGVQIMAISRDAEFFAAGIRMIDYLRGEYSSFEIQNPKHFDHLLGSSKFRQGQESADVLITRAERESNLFHRQSQEFQLYGKP